MFSITNLISLLHCYCRLLNSIELSEIESLDATELKDAMTSIASQCQTKLTWEKSKKPVSLYYY